MTGAYALAYASYARQAGAYAAASRYVPPTRAVACVFEKNTHAAAVWCLIAVFARLVYNGFVQTTRHAVKHAHINIQICWPGWPGWACLAGWALFVEFGPLCLRDAYAAPTPRLRRNSICSDSWAPDSIRIVTPRESSRGHLGATLHLLRYQWQP